MNLIFDLDGTLIDSRLRLYKLFISLVPNSNLTYDEYWELKLNKINHKQILTSNYKFTDQEFEDFEKKWLNEIENPKWLLLDKPFEGITQMLANLSSKHQLFIVTARQSEEEAVNQIKGFGWEHYFNKILVTRQKINKFDLINNAIQVEPTDFFIGDTGKDVETGKMLGIKTIAVLSGFLNKNSLLPYGADYIVNYSTDITEIINGKIQK